MGNVIKNVKHSGLEIFYIILGTFLTAFAFQVFLLPNHIIYGGVSSISIITLEYFGWSPSLVQYALNIPLLILSFALLGKNVGMKSVLGSLLMPLFIGLMGNWEPWTLDPMLGTVFGATISSLGIGLLFKFNASTGGTSIVAQLLTKYTDLSIGMAQLISDGIILFIGFLVFDLESILYGIITLAISSRIIDIVQTGTRSQKNVIIISEKHQEIRREIIDNFDRGVTQFDARGGYGDRQKNVLMIVVESREFSALERLVTSIDDHAFMVVMAASEVYGNGFSINNYLPGPSEDDYFNEIPKVQ